MKKEEFLNFLKAHKTQLLLSFCGLLAAILMLTAGFFKTLLICVLTGVLGGYGYMIDKAGFKGANAAINAAIKKLFKK